MINKFNIDLQQYIFYHIEIKKWGIFIILNKEIYNNMNKKLFIEI